MGLVEELLGCSLLSINRSFWAVKLSTGEWICEARMILDKGIVRPFDWSLDLVGTGDTSRIVELWLLCPPSPTSPLGNTARMVIDESGTAFQFKVTQVDTTIVTTCSYPQAHVIGRVVNKETGACECFIWDEKQQGLLTPETRIYDPATGTARRYPDGTLVYAGRTSVYNFHSWRPNIAPLGRIALDTLGVKLW